MMSKMIYDMFGSRSYNTLRVRLMKHEYMGKTKNWGDFVASKNGSEVTIKEEENHLMGLVH